jgi:phosphonoacetaldehyde hydrolase
MGLNKRAHIETVSALPSVAEQWKQQRGAPSIDEDVDSLYREFIPLQVDILPKIHEGDFFHRHT